MKREYRFYLCPSCFQACETPKEGHQHVMLSIFAGEPGNERRKPVMDASGNYVSRAPRWYLEATGQIPAWTPIDWDEKSRIVQ